MAPDWDELSPTPPDQGQSNAAPQWDSLSSQPPQQAAPDWESLSTQAPDQEAPERTWGEEIGRDLRTGVRAVLPTTAAVLGGLASAGAASETGPGAFVAGAAGGAAAGLAAQWAQDKAADWLGIDSPEARAADAANPSVGSRIAEFAPAALSLGTGGLSATLAQRALSGGIMGAFDVGAQALTKGEVDPTEAAVAVGTGAVLPAARAWVGKTPGVGPLIQRAVEGGIAASRPDANVNAPTPTPEEHRTATQASPTATSDSIGHAQSKPQAQGYQPEYSDGNMDAAAGHFNIGTGDLGRDQRKTAVLPAEEGIQVQEDNPGIQYTEVGGYSPEIAAALGEKPRVRVPAGSRQAEPVGEPQVSVPAQEQPAMEPANVPAQEDEFNQPKPGYQRRYGANLQPREERTPAAAEWDRLAKAGAQPEPRPVRGGNGPGQWGLGQNIRPNARQTWNPGDVVQSGFTKNLLVLAKNDDGSFRLVGKPNDEGISQAYTQVPHQGLVKEGPVDFMQATEDLRPRQPDLTNPNVTTSAMSRKRLTKPISQGTPRLMSELEKISSQFETESESPYKEKPEAVQEAIDRADERYGRVPTRARNAIEKWFNNSVMGKLTGPQNIMREGGDLGPKGNIFDRPTGEIAKHDIEANRFYRKVNIFDNALDKKTEDFFAALKPEQQVEVQNFMDGYPGAVNIKSMPEAEPALRLMRDTTRADERELRNSGLFDMDNFNKNWWPRQFTDRGKAEDFLDNWVSDNRQRKLPSLAEAQANGLELVDKNPITAFRVRRDAIQRAFALNKILQMGRDRQILSSEPFPESKPLEGMELHGRKVYAPESYATVFNREYSKSMHQNDIGHQFLSSAQPTAAFGTSMLLGLSPFHPITMLNEGSVTQMQLGMQQMARNPAQALKSIAKMPVGAVDQMFKGDPMLKEWQKPGSHPELQKIVNSLQKAGANPIGRGGDVNLKIFPKGFRAAVEELKNTPSDVTAALSEGVKGVPKVPFLVSKATLKAVGAAMHAFSSPLFEYAIPRIKAGALRETMTEWAAQNPKATDSEFDMATKRAWEDIENRYGIMNHDNIFWDKRVKEGLTLGMTSMSWTYGFGRNVLNGAKDWVFHPTRFSMKNPEYNPNMGSTLALGITVALMSGVYQYLKTGEPPKNVYDLMAGRTGGTNKHGQPERALFPGFQKDVYGWLHDPLGEAQNKLGVVPKTLAELATGKGWINTKNGPRYGPIANPADPFYKRAADTALHAASNFTPIAAQQAVGKYKEPGTNLSTAERSLSIRPAPKYINPGGNRAAQKFEEAEYKKAHR